MEFIGRGAHFLRPSGNAKGESDVSFAGDEPADLREPVILSIQTDQAGHSILKSSDSCMGGTFRSRRAALREVEDRICMSDQVTVLVIEPDKTRFGRSAARSEKRPEA